ncbi:MAG: hypothetical protein MUQ30_20080, partial [Anaerolineae bacterium]|nr:hypothetical protein [Anaerolineae bacterium]
MSKAWVRQCVRLVLLLAAFGLLTYNAQAQSPTMDEQNHMARGYALLRTGDPRLSIEHPPLINLLEALPLGGGVILPLNDPSWEAAEWYHFADLFLWQFNTLPGRMVFLSRMPVVAMTLLLGSLMARWGRALAGDRTSLVAMALVLLDPNILAHGSLATTDLGITLTTLLAAYAIWCVSERITSRRVIGAGLAVGVMLASKTSAVAFWGCFGLLFVAGVPGRCRGSAMIKQVVWRGVLYGLITVIGLLVLWAAYGWQMTPIVDGGMPIPAGTYWRGLAAVFQNVQGARMAYLLGETRLGGWAVYFPVVFAVKTPLPVLALLVLAVWRARDTRPHRMSAFLLVPVAIYWLSVLVSDLNLGYRHLLPTLPLLYLWIARCVGRPAPALWRRLSAGLVLWLAVETVLIAPHFLAYFNPVAGGPENGWRVLADSNIDWGQDLALLSDYLAANAPNESVRLSWFGTGYPERYGIDYEPLPGLPHHFDLWFESPTFNEIQPEPGLYAISVSNLVELPLIDKHFFAYFRT